MTNYETFYQLHHQDKPVLIGNAWNTYSAQILERNGFKAIATTSAAIANSLGYEDGEMIPFEELFFVAKRIISGIHVPLSVDMERGYGNNIASIVSNIEKLHDIGVVGINIEDSIAANNKREQVPGDLFGKKISDIKNELEKKNIKIFLNARTDAFLLGLSSTLETTLERIKIYEKSAADGIFVPFVKEETAIKKITAASSLPINILSMPGLPSFDKLTEWGVRRISLGSTLFRAAYKNVDNLVGNIIKEHSLSSLF